tara:strand:+ start:3034 stop:3270 length:237 start_codon:yes stop_codon:yes gene_type:complete
MTMTSNQQTHRKVGDKIKGTTVLAPAEPYISPDGTSHTELVVECKYCDSAYTARESSLRSGWTSSCGCIYGIFNHEES